MGNQAQVLNAEPSMSRSVGVEDAQVEHALELYFKDFRLDPVRLPCRHPAFYISSLKRLRRMRFKWS